MVMDCKLYRGNFDIPDEREFLEKIREISKLTSVYIVFFDSSAVAGCDHIRTALTLAERSFFQYQKPISNFFEMEILLYAFGTRQTGFASRFGIHKGENDSVILVCRRRNGRRDDFTASAGKAAFKIASLAECTGGEILPVSVEDCKRISAELSDEKISGLAGIFSITQKELEICGKNKIEELVIERCALLDVNR